MSADALACSATHAVVGCDQKKRLECVGLTSRRTNALTRLTLDINRKPVPKPKSCFGQSIELMSLQTPSVRMPKCSELGCVYALDDYAAMRTKLVRADTQLRPPSGASGLSDGLGLTSLIECYALAAGLSSHSVLARARGVSIKSFER